MPNLKKPGIRRLYHYRANSESAAIVTSPPSAQNPRSYQKLRREAEVWVAVGGDLFVAIRWDFLEDVIHPFDQEQLRLRIRGGEALGVVDVDLQVGRALDDENGDGQRGDGLGRVVAEPRDQVRLHARAIDRSQLRRRVVRRLAGFEVLENRVALRRKRRRKFAGQLRAEDVGGGAAGAGDGDEAVRVAAFRGQHSDQRAFAVAGDDDGGEALVLAKLLAPGDGVVDVGVETEIGFRDHRAGTLADAAFVVAQRRDAVRRQAFRQHQQRVVLAWQYRRIAVAIGRAGAGEQQHDRHRPAHVLRQQQRAVKRLVGWRVGDLRRLLCNCRRSDESEQQDGAHVPIILTFVIRPS